jgi:RNA recognition motif-containing protein
VLLEYEALKEAKKAIDSMDGEELLGRKIRVDWAFKRPPVKK